MYRDIRSSKGTSGKAVERKLAGRWERRWDVPPERMNLLPRFETQRNAVGFVPLRTDGVCLSLPPEARQVNDGQDR